MPVVVNASHCMGRSIQGRQYLTTEAACPFCASTAVYAHIETHISIGRWYGCSHLAASETDDTGAIVNIEFEND